MVFKILSVIDSKEFIDHIIGERLNLPPLSLDLKFDTGIVYENLKISVTSTGPDVFINSLHTR